MRDIHAREQEDEHRDWDDPDFGVDETPPSAWPKRAGSGIVARMIFAAFGLLLWRVLPQVRRLD